MGGQCTSVTPLRYSALAWARTTRALLIYPGTHRLAAAADDQARRVGAGPRRFRGVHGRTFRGTRPLSRTRSAGCA